MTQTLSKRRMALNTAVIFFLFMYSSAGTTMSPAIQKFMEAFPDTAPSVIRMVGTIPGLIAMAVMVVVGPMAGKRFRYRSMATLGLTLVAVFGGLPFFLTGSWLLILVCRVFVGLGIGLMGIRNALIMTQYAFEKQSFILGFATVAGAVFIMVQAPIVGMLADLRWNYAFLVYGLAIVFAAITFFGMTEPAPAAQAPARAAGKKGPMDGKVVLLVLTLICVAMAAYGMSSCISSFVAQQGLGNAAVAGTLVSFYTAGAALSSFTLGLMHRKLFYRCLAIYPLCGVAGIGLILWMPQFLTAAVGCMLAGFAYTGFMSTSTKMANVVASPENKTTATMLITASSQAGIFLSSYFVDVSHGVLGQETAAQSTFLGCAVVYVLMAAFYGIYRLKPRT